MGVAVVYEHDAAVVLVDGEEAELLHLLVGLHVADVGAAADHAAVAGGDAEGREREDKGLEEEEEYETHSHELT